MRTTAQISASVQFVPDATSVRSQAWVRKRRKEKTLEAIRRETAATDAQLSLLAARIEVIIVLSTSTLHEGGEG